MKLCLRDMKYVLRHTDCMKLEKLSFVSNISLYVILKLNIIYVFQGPQINKIRHEWYQTETHVIVTILLKNAAKEKLKIDYGSHLVILL